MSSWGRARVPGRSPGARVTAPSMRTTSARASTPIRARSTPTLTFAPSTAVTEMTVCWHRRNGMRCDASDDTVRAHVRDTFAVLRRNKEQNATQIKELGLDYQMFIEKKHPACADGETLDASDDDDDDKVGARAPHSLFHHLTVCARALTISGRRL